MVKEKLNNIKRLTSVGFLSFLLNIKANSKSIILIIFSFQIIFITIFFGLWNMYGIKWHAFILFSYFLILLFLTLYTYKHISYISIAKVFIWIERKNFKSINPLIALNDKPLGERYNKNIWYLHQIRTNESVKNIKYFIPKLYMDLVDPLKIRYLLFLLLFVSILWAKGNNNLLNNVKGIVNFEKYENNTSAFNIKVWLEPPKYTNLKHKYLDYDNSKKIFNLTQYVPINSKLNILINSKRNNFSISGVEKDLNIEKYAKDNYKIQHLIDKDQKLVIKQNNDKYLNFQFNVIKDKPPKLFFLSKPSTVNNTALSFISKTTDDYGLKNLEVYVNRPTEYKHFEESFLRFKLHQPNTENIDNKLVESYFHKNLSDNIWSGSKSILILEATDYADQKTRISSEIEIPRKPFKDDVALKILKIRDGLAKKVISLETARIKLINIFDNNKELLMNNNIHKKYKDLLVFLIQEKTISYSISNYLFQALYHLSEMIEDGKLYMAKKNLENIEQNLYDSINNSENNDIISNAEIFQDNIEDLLNLEKFQDTRSFDKNNNYRMKEEIDRLTQQIEDLLKTGSKKEVDKTVHKLKQLSESLKNPNKNKGSEEKFKKRREFVNKLSELLNEQEKVMKETFNRAANRGKFKQSSQGSGGKSPKERQEELRNTLGNVMRDIGSSENEIPQELGRADRAMRQASRDLENGRADDASEAQGRALEMIQRSINKINAKEFIPDLPQITKEGKEEIDSALNESYLDKNESIDYQGTSSGGRLILSEERRLKSAKKIADELYFRYNQKGRSSKDKKYIGNLLDWY